MLNLSRNTVLLNGAALLIVAASGFAVLRSLVVTEDATVCSERFVNGSRIGLDNAGAPLSAAELQGRLGGNDWGLEGAARAVKLKAGPAKHALQFDLSAQHATTGDDSHRRPGVGFVWAPTGFKPVKAACLSYAVFLPEDFDFGKGGRLPGLIGSREANTTPLDPDFSARIAWQQGGIADIYTHLPGWTLGRPMGNDRHGFALPKGRWVAIEQEVVLNDIGAKNGLVRLWIDGTLRFEKSGLGFRDAKAGTAEAAITGVMAELVMTGQAAGAARKVWLTPFELRW